MGRGGIGDFLPVRFCRVGGLDGGEMPFRSPESGHLALFLIGVKKFRCHKTFI